MRIFGYFKYTYAFFKFGRQFSDIFGIEQIFIYEFIKIYYLRIKNKVSTICFNSNLLLSKNNY